MKKFHQSQSAREKKERSLLNPKPNDLFFFYLLILFLPIQVGRHFWPSFALPLGIRVDYLSPTLYATDVLLILLFFSFIATHGTGSFIKLFSQKKLLLLFFISVTASVVFSVNIALSLYGIIKLFEYLFLGFYTVSVWERINKKLLLTLFSLSLVFESLLSLVEFFKQSSLNGIFYFFGERAFNSSTPGIANMSLNGQLLLRPYGTFPHPNVLAGYLLVVLMLLFSRTHIFAKTKEKLLLWFVILLGTLALFATFSRVAITFWTIFLFFACSKFMWEKTRLQKIIFFGLLFVFCILFFLSPLGTRFLTTRFQEEAVVRRELLTAHALVIIRAHPLFGVGPMQFIPALSHQKIQSQVLLLQPVHSIYLLILAELGSAGFFFSLFFLGKTVQRVMQQKTWRYALPFFAILTLGLFDHYFLTLQQGQLLTAVVFGITWEKRKLVVS